MDLDAAPPLSSTMTRREYRAYLASLDAADRVDPGAAQYDDEAAAAETDTQGWSESSSWSVETTWAEPSTPLSEAQPFAGTEPLFEHYQPEGADYVFEDVAAPLSAHPDVAVDVVDLTTARLVAESHLGHDGGTGASDGQAPSRADDATGYATQTSDTGAYDVDGYATDVTQYAAAGYATQTYDVSAFVTGTAADGTQNHGIEGYGTEGYGTEGYGTEGYGTEGYGTDTSQYDTAGYATTYDTAGYPTDATDWSSDARGVADYATDATQYEAAGYSTETEVGGSWTADGFAAGASQYDTTGYTSQPYGGTDYAVDTTDHGADVSGYTAEVPEEAGYPTQSWDVAGEATQSWDVAGEATQSWDVAGEATQSWDVAGEATQSWDVAGYSTESYGSESYGSESYGSEGYAAGAYERAADDAAYDTSAYDSSAYDSSAYDTSAYEADDEYAARATSATASEVDAGDDAGEFPWDSEPWVAPAGSHERVPPSRRELRGRRADVDTDRIAALRRARRARAAAWRGHLPRVGIVGALGLATVVAPVANDQILGKDAAVSAAPTAPEVESTPSAEELLAASDFRVVPGLAASGEALRVAAGTALPAEQLAAFRMEAERASRDLGRPVLPGCDGVPATTTAANGRLDLSDMCQLWTSGHYLRADAAVALAELNVAYQEHFGKPMTITDSYRSYQAQVNVRNRKPTLAARPGTSEHGWGMAVDLGGGVQSQGAEYRWLRENAPRFGWDNPAWARPGGSGPTEPWHWEYVAGQG